MANKVLHNYEYGTPAPTYPPYSDQCHLNEQIQYIPTDPSLHPLDNGPTKWVYRPQAPSSVKHLYSKDLFDYQPVYSLYPANTLYDHDYTQVYPTGMGRIKGINHHYKVFPLTNVNIRESHDYNGAYFKRPSGTYENKTFIQPNHLRTNWHDNLPEYMKW